MANRTNSNSLTSLTINKLNDKTLGFRHEILRKMKLKDDTIFADGMHSTIDFKEINKKEVDIVAKSGTVILGLIEVKVNVYEDLQPSQAKNGEYEKVAKKNGIKLFYIIPDDYSHQNELPDCATIITWEEILLMDSVKGTAYSNDIKHFAEVNMECGSNLAGKISLFTSVFTKFLIDEDLYQEPTISYNSRLDDHVTWYDLTKDDDYLAVGISTENGNVYLYVREELLDAIDSTEYGKLKDQDKYSAYSVFFNLTEDVDDEDLEFDSNFFRQFFKKIRKLVNIASNEL